MKKRMLWLLAAVMIAVLLCAGAAADSSTALWPEAGKPDKSNGKLLIDASGASDGYFFAAVSRRTSNRLKLQIKKDGVTLNYDLNTDGEFELFPFQLGDGRYDIILAENISGKKYSNAGQMSITVKLSSEYAPFLVPNQYVNYNKLSACIEMADKLCADKEPRGCAEAVAGFMKSSFVYDFIKAVSIKPGVLPDIEGSYAKKMGVCQDLSAIMIAMLRSQGVPAKLMIGNADKQYHAWVSVILDGKEILYDPTAALSAISKVRDYTLERYY